MGTLSLILAALQAGTGIYQLFKGNQAKEEVRPEYKTPKEVTDMLGIAKQQSGSDMPGYNLAKSNIDQQGATSFSRAKESASSGSDLLGFLSASGVSSNRALNQLSAANEQYHTSAQDKLKNALLTTAGFKEKEFNLNEMQPYLDSMRTSAVMTEGGMQNIFGAASGYMNNYANSKYMDWLTGGNKDQTNTAGWGILKPNSGTRAYGNSGSGSGSTLDFIDNMGGSDWWKY